MPDCVLIDLNHMIIARHIMLGEPNTTLVLQHWLNNTFTHVRSLVIWVDIDKQIATY